MRATPVSYVIISPVRNEAKHLAITISSVACQTILPTQWILVDDGSTDGSLEILDKATTIYPWITLVKRKDRGQRKPGSGVMEAFYDGYSQLRVPWTFLVKLDGDVSFAENYFESCFQKFEVDPKLGIGGGTVCRPGAGSISPESPTDPAFHVRGATKIYRDKCWSEIGGLIRAPGWDTLDELKANMLGWTTQTFSDVFLFHHKFAGSADGSWKNWVKNGLANYIVGYHPVFMAAKCLRRTVQQPYLVASCGLCVGFVSGYLKRVPQVPDRQLVRFLREQQLKSLIGSKSLWIR